MEIYRDIIGISTGAGNLQDSELMGFGVYLNPKNM